ncbi:unnamed protein product [Pleuronectes platessa]|uniref:Uncharacterized protein n=1 Tax=Pleuronectes platessa TaxID=8262 RepID=A0A9N7YMR8_PLEPL|nr:unnamed protein product [Pleuronectes platessa]
MRKLNKQDQPPGFSPVAAAQSVTDAECHLNRLRQLLHMMEDDWSELEAADKALLAQEATSNPPQRKKGQRTQSALSLNSLVLSPKPPLLHTPHRKEVILEEGRRGWFGKWCNVEQRAGGGGLDSERNISSWKCVKTTRQQKEFKPFMTEEDI